ncbi:hypothetical protein Syun_010467 [Stephania yunnanensis]|uniref:Uncharacterized protein n=1 Tax=Stephania yunnanensis TaxID=152371 RepID=A0AAP0KGK3_9MAGN
MNVKRQSFNNFGDVRIYSRFLGMVHISIVNFGSEPQPTEVNNFLRGSTRANWLGKCMLVDMIHVALLLGAARILHIASICMK